MSTFFGADVSQFQGAINWATFAANENFAIAKSSGGDAGLYTDSRLGTNRTGMRANGIKRGYYHFGSLGLINPVTEANYFVGAVGALQSGEIMALDAESEAGSGIVLSQNSVGWCKTFLDTVAAAVGFKPFIYMSQYPSYSIDWSLVAGAGYPLWVANYGASPTGNNMFVGAWSNYGYGYKIHQYTSTGSLPGIGGNVDHNAFFVPAGGSLNDWDGYGLAGTGTTPGATNQATVVTNPLTGNILTASGSSSYFYSQDNPQSLVTPTERHDQVIYSVITTDATLATGSHNAFYEIPTTINQYAYPIGIFSYDGGDTYNDFGFTLPIATTYASFPPSVQIQPAVDSAGNIFFNGVNNTGSTVNLILKIALLASASPGLMPTPAVISQSTSYTNVAKPIPSPTFSLPPLPPYATYRRIATDSSTGTGNVTVAHGQTTVPNIMFWVKVGGFVTLNAVGWQSTGSLGTLGIKMDGTNLSFHVDGGTYQDCYYRVYKDNA